MPNLMSLSKIECSEDEERMRVVAEFATVFMAEKSCGWDGLCHGVILGFNILFFKCTISHIRFCR